MLFRKSTTAGTILKSYIFFLIAGRTIHGGSGGQHDGAAGDVPHPGKGQYIGPDCDKYN